MEISFPIEFLVFGTPVSFQAKNADARDAWKDRVKAASQNVIPRRRSSTRLPAKACALCSGVRRPVRGIAMSNTVIEEQVLQREIARLESEGYDVFVQPSAPLVPEFLGDYVPDALATGNGKKIVLEVARSLES